MKCIYCGENADYLLKNGNPICKPSPNSCPERKRRNSSSQKGRNRTWVTGGEFKKGNTPHNKGKKSLNAAWNKGKTGLKGTPHTKETKKRLSEVAKKRGIGGYVKGSGRGKKGWYKGIFCDSSWELAYVVYCIEHGISIQRCREKRKYIWNGKEETYYPDFIINGNKIVEIKGYKTPKWDAKHKVNNDIKVLFEKDLKEIFDYVVGKYGKNYIELYESPN